jgi:hypothetical protein
VANTLAYYDAELITAVKSFKSMPKEVSGSMVATQNGSIPLNI